MLKFQNNTQYVGYMLFEFFFE